MFATSHCLRLVIGTCIVVGLTACQEDEPEEIGTPGMRVVAGAGITDTVDALLPQMLVVEVKNPSGKPAVGVLVRFETQAPFPALETRRASERGVFVCNASAKNCEVGNSAITGPLFLVDTTDARGRAVALVGLGTVSGRAVVRLAVPEFGFVDSATYTVNPGASTSLRVTVADTVLSVSDTTSARTVIYDRHFNVRTGAATLSAGSGNALTVNATTSIVTGASMGTQFVFARLGTLVDSASVVVFPQGRLVTWSSAQTLQLVNIDGSNVRQIATNVGSSWGVFPQFDLTRQRITFNTDGTSSEHLTGGPNAIIIADTAGASRREILPVDTKFGLVFAHRLLADGSVSVLAVRSQSNPNLGVWRVATDNSVTLLAEVLPVQGEYASADISPDGTKLAYVGPNNHDGSNNLHVLTIATGTDVIVAADARAPRWSRQSDRLVYLIPKSIDAVNGSPAVVNADGTGTRQLGTYEMNPGLSWSPDGVYLIGTSSPSFDVYNLRVIRVSDGLTLVVGRAPNFSQLSNYREPDWR